MLEVGVPPFPPPAGEERTGALQRALLLRLVRHLAAVAALARVASPLVPVPTNCGVRFRAEVRPFLPTDVRGGVLEVVVPRHRDVQVRLVATMGPRGAAVFLHPTAVQEDSFAKPLFARTNKHRPHP